MDIGAVSYTHLDVYKRQVCVCQNGIPEYAVSAVIGTERVVGAPVGWGATFQGPGCSALTTTEGRLNFTLGSLDRCV